MSEFFKKYVTKEIYWRLLDSGLPTGTLSNLKYDKNVPRPYILKKVVFVVAAELDLEFEELLWESICMISGDEYHA